MSMALGTFEVRSLAFAIAAADIAVKAAPVEIVATSYALPGVIAVTVRGSVDAVAAAVAAVDDRLASVGAMHGMSVLGRPDEAVDQLLEERAVIIGQRAGAPKVPGRGAMHGQLASAAAPAPTRATPPASAAAAPAAATPADPPAKKTAAKRSPARKATAKKATARKTSNRQGSPGRSSGTGRTTKGER